MSFLSKSYTVELYLSSGTWLDITADTVNVTSTDAFHNGGTGLAFGDSSETSFDVEVLNNGTHSLLYQVWQNSPIRVTYTTNGTATRANVGTVTERDTTIDTLTYHCFGLSERLKGTKVYSPLYYRRPAATRTTSTSIEDPSDTSYVAGLMNYLAWTSGGRPYEQSSTYTTAPFYYSFKRSILTITWAWIAGDNGWNEAQRIAQASGGYVYQDRYGVLRYETPLGFADVTPSTTLTDTNDIGGNPQAQIIASNVVTQVMCTVTPRDIGASTKVVDDKTARFIEPSEVQTIELQMQWPVQSIEAKTTTQLNDNSLTITWLDGTKVPQASGGYSCTYVFTAQQILLTVTNLSARPIEIHRISITGVPVLANTTQIITIGTDPTNIQTIQPNPYIQDRYHALRLCKMVSAVYGVSRAIVNLDTVVPKNNVQVGDVVGLTIPAWSLTAAPHVVTSVDRRDGDSVNALKLVDLAGLPKTSDFFIVGSTDYTGISKQIGF